MNLHILSFIFSLSFTQIFCVEYVTDHVRKFGLSNQIIFFQYALLEISHKYLNSTFLIDGPKTDKIQNCYGHHNFYDFFRLRNLSECMKLVVPESRIKNCKIYYSILSSSLDKYPKKIKEMAQKIVPETRYCMPWPHKSSVGGKFHCPEIAMPNLPFFFELFDFQPFIKKVGDKFLNDNKFSHKNFTAVHFRAGDFKTRGIKDCYHSFEKVMDFTNKNIKDLKAATNIFVMAQSDTDVPSSIPMIRKGWLSLALEELGYKNFLESLEFVKLLVDIYIVSASQFIVGNHYSTLTEIVISNSHLNDKKIKYTFL